MFCSNLRVNQKVYTISAVLKVVTLNAPISVLHIFFIPRSFRKTICVILKATHIINRLTVIYILVLKINLLSLNFIRHKISRNFNTSLFIFKKSIFSVKYNVRNIRRTRASRITKSHMANMCIGYTNTFRGRGVCACVLDVFTDPRHWSCSARRVSYNYIQELMAGLKE